MIVELLGLHFGAQLLGERFPGRKGFHVDAGMLGSTTAAATNHLVVVEGDAFVVIHVLRDGFGRYLAGERNGWSFTDDFTQARVFDFIRDRIAEQVESLRREHGLELSILAVDPLERYEICDACGSRSMPYSTFFDGNRFLCPTCNTARGQEAEGEKSLKG